MSVFINESIDVLGTEDTHGTRGDVTSEHGSMLFWIGLTTCAVAVVALSLMMFLLFGVARDPTAEDQKYHSDAAERDRRVDYLCARAPASATSLAESARSNWSSPIRSEDDLGVSSCTHSEAGSRGGPATQLPLALLCPQLVVPSGSKLQCALTSMVFRKRQNAVFTIRSLPERGGTALFRVRLAEAGSSQSTPRMYLETLSGSEQFASMATDEVHEGVAGQNPKLTIMRRGGPMPYAVMSKNDEGDYTIVCDLGLLLKFRGNFSCHKVEAYDGDNNKVGAMSETASGSHEILVYPNTDAGLMTLGMLGIDKCERSSA